MFRYFETHIAMSTITANQAWAPGVTRVDEGIPVRGPGPKSRATTRLPGHNMMQRLRRRSFWPVLRLILLVGIYSGVLMTCRWLAYQLRFDFDVPQSSTPQLSQHWLLVLGIQMTFLGAFRQFSGVTRYFNLPDVKYLMLAMA